MLSLKNLVKTYNVKGKVPVRAIDGITVDLPETDKYGKIITLSNHSLKSTRFMLNASSDGAYYSMDNAIYTVTTQITGIITQMKRLF